MSQRTEINCAMLAGERNIADSPTEDGCADDLIDAPPLGRRRRCRTQFSDAGLSQLEESFATDPYPDVTTREELARMLSVTEDRIQVWFQNHRSKQRRQMAMATRSKVTVTAATPRPLTLAPPNYLPWAVTAASNTRISGAIPSPCVATVASCTVSNTPTSAHRLSCCDPAGTARQEVITMLGDPFSTRHHTASDQDHRGAAGSSIPLQTVSAPSLALTPAPVPVPALPLAPPPPPVSSSEVSSTVSKDTPCKPSPSAPTRGCPQRDAGSPPASFQPRRPWEDQPKQRSDTSRDDVTTRIHHSIPAGFCPPLPVGVCPQTGSGPMFLWPPFYSQPEVTFPLTVGELRSLWLVAGRVDSWGEHGVRSGQLGQRPLYTGATTRM